MASLFQELGGATAIKQVVNAFYFKVLAHPEVQEFFANTDMEEQRKKQTKFLSYVFGGLPNYPGKSMRESHKPLVEKGLNDRHVDVILELLEETLREFEIGEEKIKQVIAIGESVRDEVLNRDPQSLKEVSCS